MINTITALQEVYVSLGGNLSDVINLVTIPDMLVAIADLYASIAEEERPITSDEINAIINNVA